MPLYPIFGLTVLGTLVAAYYIPTVIVPPLRVIHALVFMILLGRGSAKERAIGRGVA